MTNLDSILKNRDITLPAKVRLVKAMVFLVVMYGCESWTIKKAECQRIELLSCGIGEDSWESLGPVHPKGDQSCVFFGRTDVEAETPILDAKSWLIGKDPDSGKDWGQEEKGTTEDEMVGWNHRFNGLVCVLSHSVVSNSATPWTVACQASLSMRILQEMILEWVATPSSRGSSQPRDWTQISYIAGGFFTIWATREALNGHEFEQTPGDSKGQGSWCAAIHRIAKRVGQDLGTEQEQQSKWLSCKWSIGNINVTF